MRRIGIAADADDSGARLEELFVGVAEGAGFLRADGGVVLRVEEEDDDVLGPEIGQRDARAVVEGEGDVGGGVAGLDGGHESPRPSGTIDSSPAFQRWVTGCDNTPEAPAGHLDVY